MTDQSNTTGDAKTGATETTSANTTRAKETTARAPGKQKFTEKELKRLGLDPAPYGYVKK